MKSNSGIGEELAYQLAKRNCKLILTSRTQSKLEEMKQTCLKQSTGLTSDDILVLAYDISDFSKNDDAFKQIVNQFGDIDILVCNAGRAVLSEITDEPFDDARKIFDTNFFSHVYITKMVLKHWLAIKAKTGLKQLNKQILATSSILSIIELPFASSYSATKRSMNIFFHDVAMQHQRRNGIYVTVVLPGPVESELLGKSIPQNRTVRDDYLKKMTAKRCAHLMLVSLANKVHSTWIANQPSLLMLYLSNRYAYALTYIFRRFGTKLAGKYVFEQ